SGAEWSSGVDGLMRSLAGTIHHQWAVHSEFGFFVHTATTCPAESYEEWLEYLATMCPSPIDVLRSTARSNERAAGSASVREHPAPSGGDDQPAAEVQLQQQQPVESSQLQEEQESMNVPQSDQEATEEAPQQQLGQQSDQEATEEAPLQQLGQQSDQG